MSAPPAPHPVQAHAPRRRPLLRYSFAAVFTLLTALTALPDLLFGLDRRSPWAQLVAFRPLLLCGLLALCVLLGVITLLRRAAWPFLAGGLAVLLVGVAMLAPRFMADPVPTTGKPLTVLSFNVYEGRADTAALASAIREKQPDLVALPEAGPRFKAKITPLVEPLGYRAFSTTSGRTPDVEGVTVLVAARLGDVRTEVGEDMSAFPDLEVTGGGLGSLRFVGYHTVAPTPGDVPHWRSDLAQLAKWCAGPTPVVVAGDYNASLDHSSLRGAMAGCGDAADQRGDGLIPTWGPVSFVRTVLGPQIDHVLSTAGIEAESFDVLDLPGSDHRAILTTLRIPD